MIGEEDREKGESWDDAERGLRRGEDLVNVCGEEGFYRNGTNHS